MARYQIIDEPDTKPWGENLIVDPVLILFAAIIVPLFWQPPYMGRYWIPALWLLVTGIALGSSTLKEEIATMILGAIAWYGVFWIIARFWSAGFIPGEAADVYPYLHILQFGVFFLTLYLVVFKQSQSYAIFDYVRGRDR